MNTTEPPYFQVSCPYGEVEGNEIAMCLPGAEKKDTHFFWLKIYGLPYDNI